MLLPAQLGHEQQLVVRARVSLPSYAQGVLTDRDIARWRLHSQRLAAPVHGAEEAVHSLLAVQAENPSQSAWAVATRTLDPRQSDLAGLLANGRVLRTHVLRPTWHYVHAEDALWLIEPPETGCCPRSTSSSPRWPSACPR